MSKRQSRYKYWWYQLVVDMIKNYDNEQEGEGRLVKKFRKCISIAFDELESKEDGDKIKKAIYMKYIDNTHTFDGVALTLYSSTRTVKRWISDFVYRVAELAELK